MAELCTDNRFELIKKYKQKLMDATNIETSAEEIAVIDDILFRFWQMGWLNKLEQPEQMKGEWIEISSTNHVYKCSECGRLLVHVTDGKNNVSKHYPYCHCGADMR